jgi:hypothetical protein
MSCWCTAPGSRSGRRPRIRAGPFADPTLLTGAVEVIPARAVLCVPARFPFGEWARGLGYATVELESGHDAMVTAPGALTGLLLEDA